MKVKSVAFFVLVVLCGIALYQPLHYYPQLPEKMATHFGFDGEADGWSAKRQFVVVYILILFVTVGSILGPVALMKYMPASMINIPHREHWLAPERKKTTVAYVCEVMLWIANATILLLIAVMQSTVRANLNPPASLGLGFGVTMALYMTFIFAMVAVLYMRFRKPSG